MQRLIDADKHIEYLNAKRDVCLRFNNVLGAQVYQVAIDEIKGADSIDAEPVVHGHWIQKEFDCVCSNCGSSNGAYGMKYCSDCGQALDWSDEE